MANTVETNVASAALPQVSDRRFPALSILDNGKVRLGGQGPLFRPASIADAGKVRLGGQGPIFR